MENNTSPYYDIVLTDICLHIAEPRKPESLGRKIAKTIRSGKSGRAYGKIIKTKDKEFRGMINLEPGFEEARRRAEGLGKKLRILVPKDGLKIYPGGDVLEYLEAKKRKQEKLDRIKK